MAATKQKYRRTTKSVQVPQAGLSDKVALVAKSTLRSDFPRFKAGDTVRIHQRIKEGEKERIQIFEGVVIARGNHGAGKSFTVRKMSHGVGVERIFLETCPKIARLELVQEGRVRRAKLYYLRGLEGRAARIEREVETLAATAASAAAKESNKVATAASEKKRS